MQIALIFRQSGEVAGVFDAPSPLDALIQFYGDVGWPLWVWIDGKPVKYQPGNAAHLRQDLRSNWAVYALKGENNE